MNLAAPWARHLRLLVLLPLLSVSQAIAQALPAATGPGSYVALGGGASALQADYGQRVLGGPVLWADVNLTWRIGLEGEARSLNRHTSEDVTERSYLGGIRYTLRPQRIRPYAKFLAGAGEISLPFHYAQGTFLTLAPGAGVEYIVSDRLLWRVADFEYQSWPSFPDGNLHPYGVSMGLLFRLNEVDRLPRGNTHR